MGHFYGRVKYWDVVNEALSVNNTGEMQDNVFLRKLGPGYVDDCFRVAHQVRDGRLESRCSLPLQAGRSFVGDSRRVSLSSLRLATSRWTEQTGGPLRSGRAAWQAASLRSRRIEIEASAEGAVVATSTASNPSAALFAVWCICRRRCPGSSRRQPPFYRLSVARFGRRDQDPPGASQPVGRG